MDSSPSSSHDSGAEPVGETTNINGASFQIVGAPLPPIVTQPTQATQPQPIHTPLPPPIDTPRVATSNHEQPIPPSSFAASSVNTNLDAILPDRRSRRIANFATERESQLQSIRRVIDNDRRRRVVVGDDAVLDDGDDCVSIQQSTSNSDEEDDVENFNSLNEQYAPPSDKEHPTPDFCEDAIRSMMIEGLGVPTPRDCQIRDIFLLSFLKVPFMYLIRKCGEGKSLVSIGAATILRGFSVVLVPLHGLGSDQVSKSKFPKAGVHAYHVDEFRDADYPKLMERLQSYSPDDESTIICYISPQQLKKGSGWYLLLMNLAQKGYISLITVDEVHATVENHDSFRTETY